VEVKEGPGSPRESTALALAQLGELAQFEQQHLQTIKVVLRGMPHTSEHDVGRQGHASTNRSCGSGSDVDCCHGCGQLSTKDDMPGTSPEETAICWTILDDSPKPTDQKVGGSSPSERAQVNSPLRSCADP
jgi:hypothetical protein